MLRALTFALAMLAAATPSSANVLVFDDLSGFYEFDKKSLTVLQDLDDAAKSALTPNSTLTSDCLNNLFQNLELTKSGVAVVEALASLDINMVNAADEQAVLNELADRLRSFLGIFAIQRQAINRTMGQQACRAGVVAVKAQEILQLYTKLGSVVQAINSKVRFKARTPR